ncbi:MAG: DNA recombination protein RmuC [Alphaproteobacteria bacterium]|nr:DNA recombination protein RmuC [Alphaproteobacteria bacterium]MCW5743274.1 DNA recombination protein RmuC [Alphaproteobacteria bacterium]
MPPLETLLPVVIAALVLGLAIGWLARSGQVRRHTDDAHSTRLQLAGAQTTAARVPELEQRLVDAERESDALLSEKSRLQTLAERLKPAEDELAFLRARVDALSSAKTKLEENQRNMEAAHAEKTAALTALREDIDARLKAMADAALGQSQSRLIELAEQLLKNHHASSEADLAKRQVAIDQLVKPVAETLEAYQKRLAELEQRNAQTYGALSAELKNVVAGQESVRGEAARLTQALRAAPKTRGRWGEQQLRRVMELAGMSEHVDFVLEHSVATESGRLRPDAIIRLPGGRSIVVDAKTSLSAYLEAIDAADEAVRDGKLVEHARQIRQHVALLAAKDYWSQFEDAPDFVAMFVPGENFYSAAAERDPDLFEFAISRRVLVCTPTTLVALAKAVAYGWGQVKANENAAEIARLGNELYGRLAVMAEPIVSLGKSLEGAAAHYNRFIGSMEGRVFPTARQIRQLSPGDSPRPLPDLKEIETAVRQPRTDGDLLPPVDPG